MQMDFLNAVPVSPENPPISFSLIKSPPDNAVRVGKSQTYSIAIKNPGDAQGMLISRISMSSCYDIDMNQLEILKDQAKIDNFELSADKTLLTLYWTYIKQDEKKEVSLTFVKKYGGGSDSVCQARASQAYLYYQDEERVWVTDRSSKNVLCNEKEHDYSAMNQSTIEPEPLPPRPPRPPIIDPIPIEIEPPVFRDDENRIFVDKVEEPVKRELADWEVALMEWDAQPDGVVAAARPERPPRNVDPVVDNEPEVETWREGDRECKKWKNKDGKWEQECTNKKDGRDEGRDREDEGRDRGRRDEFLAWDD